ncbi:MAG TPA: flagellar biosynthetic protein FliR [Gammaproteobacteria bacterium]|nr:flagellar biosynthetic protein FliR [Gammaproteobacteria bacterium]
MHGQTDARASFGRGKRMIAAPFQLTDADLVAAVARVLWPLARIAAMLAAAPLFGARTVPVRLRAALGFALAIVAAPLVPAPAGIEPFSPEGAVVLLREAAIGAGLGFLLQMAFGAVAMAGEIVAFGMGLSFASIVDPERGVGAPLVGQYFVVLATLLFLALDGHLALISLLVESFRSLPPAATGLTSGGFLELAGWGARMFEAAVLVALPAAAALLVASLSIGLIARSAPQLNVFAVGFPLTLMLGIVALAVGLPALAPQFERLLEAALGEARTLIGAWQ